MKINWLNSENRGKITFTSLSLLSGSADFQMGHDLSKDELIEMCKLAKRFIVMNDLEIDENLIKKDLGNKYDKAKWFTTHVIKLSNKLIEKGDIEADIINHGYSIYNDLEKEIFNQIDF